MLNKVEFHTNDFKFQNTAPPEQTRNEISFSLTCQNYNKQLFKKYKRCVDCVCLLTLYGMDVLQNFIKTGIISAFNQFNFAFQE